MTLKPLGDRIVIEPDPVERTLASGLVLPDTTGEKPQIGTVLAVGEGKLTLRGNVVPLEVERGQRVLFSKYGGTEVEEDESDRLILREIDILAIVEEE